MGIFFVGVIWVGWFVLWICILMLVTSIGANEVGRMDGGGSGEREMVVKDCKNLMSRMECGRLVKFSSM